MKRLMILVAVVFAAGLVVPLRVYSASWEKAKVERPDIGVVKEINKTGNSEENVCETISESGILGEWSVNKIDNADYKITGYARIGEQYCRVIAGSSYWTKTSLPLTAVAVVPPALSALENSICVAYFNANTTYSSILNKKLYNGYNSGQWVKDIYKKFNGTVIVEISNANQSGKLLRPIFCDANVFGFDWGYIY